MSIVELHQGQVLYEAGEPLRYTYFPHDTIIALCNIMQDGRSAEMVVYGREGATGLLNSLVNRQSFGRYIVQFDGTASRIEIGKLEEIVITRPAIHQIIQRYLEALSLRTLQSVACNAIHDVEARTCRWILSTCVRIDQETIPLTHERLAEVIGVQRSTMSAILKKLQERGLIRQIRGGIIVTDRAGLERATCECYWRIGEMFKRILPHALKEGWYREDRQTE
ncbi:Crp/Fnr family transcriptional regulator [Microvirga sp. TS319]|uniref:Crp/Fnr family transcriptional regulator n=1 Tax=Microvirga sp. TS319 TaxID=3241165 RepID=UPI00351AB124